MTSQEALRVWNEAQAAYDIAVRDHRRAEGALKRSRSEKNRIAFCHARNQCETLAAACRDAQDRYCQIYEAEERARIRAERAAEAALQPSLF